MSRDIIAAFLDRFSLLSYIIKGAYRETMYRDWCADFIVLARDQGREGGGRPEEREVNSFIASCPYLFFHSQSQEKQEELGAESPSAMTLDDDDEMAMPPLQRTCPRLETSSGGSECVGGEFLDGGGGC